MKLSKEEKSSEKIHYTNEIGGLMVIYHTLCALFYSTPFSHKPAMGIIIHFVLRDQVILGITLIQFFPVGILDSDAIAVTQFYLILLQIRKSEKSSFGVSGEAPKWSPLKYEIRRLMSKFFKTQQPFLDSQYMTVPPSINTVFPLTTKMDELFVRLVRNENTFEEQMVFELMRLASLDNFPNVSGLSFLRLARAGFYYTGDGDRLSCFSCGFTYGGWQLGEDPIRFHSDLSPQCPFLNTDESGNIPVGETPQSQLAHRRNPEEVRPCLQNDERFQHPPTNADGGLDDRTPLADLPPQPVQSYPSVSLATDHNIPSSLTLDHDRYGGRLNSRNESSSTRRHLNSRTEHPSTPREIQNNATRLSNSSDAGYHPQFGEVKYMRYSRISARVSSYSDWPRHLKQTPQELSEAGFFYTGFNDAVRCFCCGIGLWDWQPEDNPWMEHARHSSNCTLAHGGEIIDLEQEAIGRLSHSGSSHTSQTQGDATVTSGIQESSYNSDTGWSGLAKSRTPMEITTDHEKNDDTSNDGACAIPQSDEIRKNVLREENRELRERNLCKICSTDPPSIVFLPCGHLCCCVQCAQLLKKCPICRKAIVESVRSYRH